MDIDIVPFQARLERMAFNNHMQVVQFANIESENLPFGNNFLRAMVIGQSFGDLLMENFGKPQFEYHLQLIKNHIANTALHIYHLLTIEGYDAIILEPLFLKGESELSNINKNIASLAGVGKTGKKGFFVSPTYGVKIVLCSILTNAPLEFDPAYSVDLCSQCGICENHDFEESVLKCPYGKDKYRTN